MSKDDSKQCLSIFHNAFSDPLLIERFLLIIYALIFIIGLVGNIMTIIIIKYNRYLRTPTNFYLLNLAVSDLMMLMCNLPLEMIEIHYRQWPLPVIFCKLRNICAEFFTCSSILTILAFTCERYFAIVHPVHFHQLSHFRRAQNVIIIIWFISLIFSLPLGLSYEIDTSATSLSVAAASSFSTNSIVRIDRLLTNKTMESVRFNSTSSTSSSTSVSIIYCNSCVPKKKVAELLSIIMILTSLFFFYLPMFIIGAIYLFIGHALRRANKFENNSNEIKASCSSISSHGISVRKGLTSSPCHSGLIKQESIEMKQQQSVASTTAHVGSYSWLKTRARCQARQVVVKTLVAVVIAFFVCYAPLYFQRLLSAIMTLNPTLIAESDFFGKTMAYLYVISGMTFYFGSVINPILYNVVSNKYRRAFRDLFCCRLTWKKKSSPKQPTQRKLFQTPRYQHQSVHYFIGKTAQIQYPQKNSAKFYPDSNRQGKISIDPTLLPIGQKSMRPVGPTIPSSRSNSSSMSASPSRASLPVPAALTTQTQRPNPINKFSFRETFFGRKTRATNVPWLMHS